MSTIQDETTIRASFAAARALEPTDEEIADVLVRAGRRRSRIALPTMTGWRRVALPALAVALLVTSGYAAVPPLRAAIDDAAGTFADFVAGDDSAAPGRSLRRGESVANSLPRKGEPRVIAEGGGYELQFVRARDGGIDFDLGETGIGIGLHSLDELSGHAVYLLGPGAMENADERGHVPLFGLTAPQVETIELSYASGPPLRIDRVEGGFVLLAEPTRAPREVIGYGAAGEEVERASLDHIGWNSYGPPAPPVPVECMEGAAGLNPPPPCPQG